MFRVLQINDYPPDKLGGAEVMMKRTVNVLRDAGCDVETFTQADLSDARLTVPRYISNRVACRALVERLNTFRPEIVHLHNYYHLLSPAILSILGYYKRRANARVVMTVHDYHLACPNSGGNWFQNGLQIVDLQRLASWRYLLSRRWDHRGRGYSFLRLMQHIWHYRLGNARSEIDLCLCPSKFIQRVVDNIGIPTVLLPLPNPPILAEPSKRPTQLTIIFAGRIEREKGLNLFLEHWASDAKAKIIIVGDGSERAKVEATVKRRGLADRTTFLGRLPHDQTMQQIASAHLLIQPSLLFENYPLSLIEALSVGTNVLVSDYGGMREIVQDSGVGFVFDPGEPENIAVAWKSIEREFQEQTLNAFDVSHFLAERSENAYRDALLRIYDGRAVAA